MGGVLIKALGILTSDRPLRYWVRGAPDGLQLSERGRSVLGNKFCGLITRASNEIRREKGWELDVTEKG